MSMNPSRRRLLLAVTVVISLATTTAEQQSGSPPITPGKHCSRNCGNVSIPFPFGVEAGWYLPGFEILCDKNFDPPRPFLIGTEARLDRGYYDRESGDGFDNASDSSSSPMELKEVSVEQGEARVWVPLSSYCPNNPRMGLQFQAASPFLFSSYYNVLIGIGLNAYSTCSMSMNDTDNEDANSCVSRVPYWKGAEDGPACTGKGCCEAASIRYGGTLASISVDLDNSKVSRSYPNDTCSFGMLVEKGWYNFTVEDTNASVAYMANKFPGGVPLVLDFAIRGGGACPPQGQQPPNNYACKSGNSSCVGATDGDGYYCSCSQGYQGNPYIADGCQDINECLDERKCNDDHLECKNKPGGYDCVCKGRWRMRNQTCADPLPLPAMVVPGAIGGLLLMAVLTFIALIQKQKRKRAEFFKRNDGPTLEKANTIKIFKKVELQPFIKSGNLVGKGNFGEVYKGRLLDQNQSVAIKKPINLSVAHNGQFANEVDIQTQVKHKNIAKLIGCCLEVDIPMLVYEFASKGSLDEILHGSTRVPLNLGVRLNIAAESAQGLAYMHSHSGMTTTILHGDVKPANILLNDDYVPKISDFGISKLINKGVAQHNSFVIGDMTYMDPVYLQTGLLTDKSDVYSFGVVILELISRKKATYTDDNSLVRNFVDAYTNNKRVPELFDEEIAEASNMEILDCLAGIAVECLNLDVDQRPEMAVVAERLLMLERSWNI